MVEYPKEEYNKKSNQASNIEWRIADLLLIKTSNWDLHKHFPDIIEVWPSKMLWSYPEKTIKERSIDGVAILRLYAKKNNLWFIHIRNWTWSVKGNPVNGVLIYDPVSLGKYLLSQAELLQKYNIPTDAKWFVVWTVNNFAYYDQMPEISDIITHCYNRPSKKVYSKSKKGRKFSLDEPF